MEQEFKPRLGEEIEIYSSPNAEGFRARGKFIGKTSRGNFVIENESPDDRVRELVYAAYARPIQQEKPADKTPREQFEEKFGKDCWGVRVDDEYFTDIVFNDSSWYTYTYFRATREELPTRCANHIIGLLDGTLRYARTGVKRLVRVSPAIGITKNGPTVLSPHAVESRHAASTWFNLNGLCVDEIQWPLRSADGSPVWYIREEDVE